MRHRFPTLSSARSATSSSLFLSREVRLLALPGLPDETTVDSVCEAFRQMNPRPSLVTPEAARDMSREVSATHPDCDIVWPGYTPRQHFGAAGVTDHVLVLESVRAGHQFAWCDGRQPCYKPRLLVY